MKGSGIVRNVNQPGRIVILVEIKKIMSINIGDPLEIAKENNQTTLRKYKYSSYSNIR